MQVTESIKVDEKTAKELLLKKGFVLNADNNPYVAWRGSCEAVVAIYYTSGKLVLQGTGDVKKVYSLFEIGKENDTEYIEHIGSDEVGKGDYFGPLVVACCYLSKENYEKALKIGVRDSKSMSDEKIIALSEKIERIFKYKIKVIPPLQYNEDVQRVGNISILLSQYHLDNIKELSSELKNENIVCKKVVIDQFSKRKDRLLKEANGFELEQFHKGESDIVVAAASMLARKTFLERMEDLKFEYGIDFPRGATSVIEKAREFVAKYSENDLKKVAKVSFKTTQKVLFNLS